MVKYYGGKAKHGKKIHSFIVKFMGHTPGPISYIEPFCGALGVMRYFSKPGEMACLGNDICTDLIMMWNGVKSGTFENPNITKKDWQILKATHTPSAERAFAGFGLSFSGSWFTSYVDCGEQAYSSLMKIQKAVKNVTFYNQDYKTFLDDIIPRCIGTTTIVYMDPPYGSGSCNNPWNHYGFNPSEFWDVVKGNGPCNKERVADPPIATLS